MTDRVALNRPSGSSAVNLPTTRHAGDGPAQRTGGWSREMTGVGSLGWRFVRHALISRVSDLLHVELKLEPASDPIAGTLAAGDDQPVAFVGWMQLTGLLARVVSSTAAVEPGCERVS
jgi:hypothetical protein